MWADLETRCKQFTVWTQALLKRKGKRKSTVESMLSIMSWTNIFQLNYATACFIPILLLLFAHLYRKFAWNYQQRRDILQRMKRKQADAAEKKRFFRTRYDSVTPRQEELVSLAYPELRAALQTGTLTAVEVVEAYLAKAVSVDGETNAVTEFLDDAVDRARRLDRLEPEERGPMHGIPISAKEVLQFSGLDCTVGIPGNLRRPLATADATIIQLLKKLGAVLFCRTNMAQTCISFECSNPIFGVTNNIQSKERSPGGSSGGEGALIGGGGSMLGMGTDLGGSIRIPSMYNGIACLKPTAGRLPLSGQGSDGGSVGIVGNHNTIGFMAKTVEALEGCMSQVCSYQALESVKVDARLVPMPWNEDKAKRGRKLRIGWYDSDGLIEPAPACRRAVAKATKLLEAQGHTLVEFRPPCLERLRDLYFLFATADGGRSVLELLENSPVDHLSIGTHHKTWTRNQTLHTRLADWIRRRLGPAGAAAHLFGRESAELWQLNDERLLLVEKVLRAWDEQDLDVVVAPGMSVPALKLGYAQALTPAISYTLVYNILNFPAGTVPVCKVTAQDEEDLEEHFPGYERNEIYGLMKEGSRGAVGTSLNVQVIGRPWSEELVLRAMREVEKAVLV